MSRLGAYDEHNEIPIMVRGEGTRVYDANGTEYFDGLAGLFTNALGHGRRDIGDAAAAQIGELGFFPTWTYAHPKAIELAERLASLTPGDLNRVFFTPVALRRMRVPGNSRATTTSCAEIWTATRSSAATLPTTARRSVLSRSPHSSRTARPSSHSSPERSRCPRPISTRRASRG